MRKTIGLSLLCTLLAAVAATGWAQGLSPAKPEEVGMSSERLARLDDVMKEALDRGDIPGAVLLVIRKGKTVWRKAYGDSQRVPEKRPMEAGMIFDLASLTKPVATATSIMILVERGMIGLKDKVKNYFSDFLPYGSEAGRPGEDARLWHLLTHTSGLPSYLDPREIEQKYGLSCSAGSVIKAIAGIKKESPPGQVLTYSCLNYIVLAAIVKQVSGKDIAAFAAKNIFEPLGMKRTFYNPPAEYMGACVPTQVADGKSLQGIVHDPLARLQGGVSGNAGLFSTADDLSVFAQMMLDRGRYGQTVILSPLSVERMTEIFPRVPESGRSLGWDVNSDYSAPRGDLFGRSSYGHSGYTGTSIWIDPETRTAIILLTNRVHPDDKGDVRILRGRVSNVVAAAVMEK